MQGRHKHLYARLGYHPWSAACTMSRSVHWSYARRKHRRHLSGPSEPATRVGFSTITNTTASSMLTKSPTTSVLFAVLSGFWLPPICTSIPFGPTPMTYCRSPLVRGRSGLSPYVETFLAVWLFVLMTIIPPSQTILSFPSSLVPGELPESSIPFK